MFARLVPAQVFKTCGGCEQRPQWIRFPYTPARLAGAARVAVEDERALVDRLQHVAQRARFGERVVRAELARIGPRRAPAPHPWLSSDARPGLPKPTAQLLMQKSPDGAEPDRNVAVPRLVAEEASGPHEHRLEGERATPKNA